jgi:hypothetical protein
MLGFLLKRKGQVAGYFIVGQSGWEARLLDLFIDSDDANDWKWACAAMTNAIRPTPEVCRIRALATVPILNQALEWNGYWRHCIEPIFIYHPSRRLEDAFPVAFCLCDGDSGY